jgi:lysophospholipase L1-like esterase
MDRLNAIPGGHRVWVGNVGISAYSTVEHLRLVAEPDLMRNVDCVVLMPGINDFARYVRGNLFDLGRAEPLWRGSRLWDLARTAARAARIGSDPREEDAGPGNYQLRRQQRRTSASRSTFPDLSPAVSEYRRRIEAIIRHCQAMGVRTIFLSQPVLWDEGLSEEAAARLWFGRTRDGAYLTVAALRAGLEQYNQAARETCAGANVEWIDLSALSGREDLFYDDCHFNENGAEVVAGILAEYFAGNPVEPPAGPSPP